MARNKANAGGRHGRHTEKEQVSIEEITALAFGVAIAIVASLLILQLFNNVSNTAPSSCSFAVGVSCSDLVLSSNSTSTEFAILGTNAQEYPITALSLSVGLDGQVSRTQCTTGKIRPGQTFVCFGKLSNFQKPGYPASGNLTVHVGYCGFNGGDCATAQPQNFIGTYTAPTSRFLKPHIGLQLLAPNGKVNGDWPINASFDIFGYTLYLGTITVIPHNGMAPTVNYSGPSISSLNVSVSTLANDCAAMLNVTYANQTGIGIVELNATNYTGSNYQLSGNTNSNCYQLSNTTKTVKVSGQNNTAGVFLLSNVSINISSTGGYNNLAVFNSTATVKIAGNNNNVTFFGSNVALDITGTYNMVKLINSRLLNLTAGGNNNLIVLYNTTVFHQSVTGVNDVIQNT